MLDDALEDEGRHGGVDDVVGDAALGQPGLLVLAGVDGVSYLSGDHCWPPVAVIVIVFHTCIIRGMILVSSPHLETKDLSSGILCFQISCLT